MKNSRIAGLAILFCLGAAGSALAAWDSLGSVDVSGRGGPGMRGPGMMMRGPDRDSRSFNLGGPVERVQLRAERSDINCRSVMARFGNGRSNDIFHGMLRQGRTADIDLPGRARDLNGLVFSCTSMDRRGGTIRISADIGRYRNDWMRGPNWRATWSRMFNWGSNAVNNWQMVGHESFEGRNDSEMTNVGLRGRHVDAIALMPVNADARCSSVTARFDNGRSQKLALRNGDFLRRGAYTQVDLPGNYRNLDGIALRCRATNARSVTINIYTSH